ncbi:DUF1365 family protein [Nocardioides sp. BGMRC 2183]|nr:DUF1365 family protein [Nocardioides sp. BGMRC 2183]
MPTDDERAVERVAVIGSGVAGLVAAYVASRTAEVTLYEADGRLGGHADTHLVQDTATGRELAIDTGFIVHNERTYPTLLRLFAELGVPTQPSEMSLSVSDRGTGVEWAGALGPRGLFPGGRNLRDPHFWRMLTEIPRFHRQARALLAGQQGAPATADLTTLGSFLDDGRFTPYFRRHFMEPLVAAVWSTDPADALDYPAGYLFTFLAHHGMLGVFGSPTWRTVTGGSVSYVDAVAHALTERGGKIALDATVTSVAEHAGGVRVAVEDGVEEYDAAVIATHPAAALGMLTAPTAAQTEVLSALPYAANTALLHTDTSLLPQAGSARAAWNFRRPAESPNQPGRGSVLVTYDLTRLQRLDTTRRYLVTLGAEDLVDPATVLARRAYEHPQYTPSSVAARARLPEIDTDRIVFAGAYHGWGFHEDGARSGLAAVERLGFGWPTVTVVPDISVASDIEIQQESQVRRTPSRTAYATTLTHTRRAPLRHRFTLRSRMWVVDLDDPRALRPRAGWRRGTFEGRDHFTGEEVTVREGLDRFLAEAGLDLRGGRALMAAQPRALGHCFNPISVHWVWRAADGPERGERPDATVVEVHNTYGDRHAYLLDVDADGRGAIDKAMYVSPFHGTDGHYQVRVPSPTRDLEGRLQLAVTLDPGPQTPESGRFTAALTGTPAPEPRVALAGLRGAVSIHLHGVWLWLRRVPVQPRPTDHPAPHGDRTGGRP